MRVMGSRSRARETQDEVDRRGVLSHIEHLRSIGEAFVRAADTYVTGHRISDLESNWRDDLGSNLADASKEFHSGLSDAHARAYDIYTGRATEVNDFEDDVPRRPRTASRTAPRRTTVVETRQTEVETEPEADEVDDSGAETPRRPRAGSRSTPKEPPLNT